MEVAITAQPLHTAPHRATVDLRETFRGAATSTWVVTSAHGGRPVGFTAISVVSVSVDPPIVSFNLARSSSSRSTIEASGRVALHLLGDRQEGIARRFAGERSARFACDGLWRWHEDELPALPALARLSTEVLDQVPAGDSYVLTASVLDVDAEPGLPLVHHGAGYRAL